MLIAETVLHVTLRSTTGWTVVQALC